MRKHPFLEADFLPAWSSLQAEHIVPDITLAVARAEAAIAAIAGLELTQLTYASTFLALERATEALTVAWAKVSHLQAVADTAPLREAYNAMLPKVSAFYAGIPLNAALWQRLRTFAETPEGRALTGVHRRLVDETLADFRQAGADLPAAARARLEAIQAELAQLTQRYAENVLDATNAWQLVVSDERRLAGLPAHALA